MNIAQVCHVWESVPPRQYGGTERVVSYLTEELVRLGHTVTLFASGDSTTTAHLEAVCPTAIRFTPGVMARDASLALLLERAFGTSHRFDVIHSHLDFLAFPLTRRCRAPVVTTLHGRLDLPELQSLYAEFKECPLVSISYSQRGPCPFAHWHANVYHGLPQDQYAFHPHPGQYLAFIGRLSPEKRPDQAVRIAERVGLPLRIAAKVDPVDREYIEGIMKPLLSHPLVEYVGEITDAEKDAFLGEAMAVLCPYQPEPFGLALIEALACGTPVITYRHGSFPEMIDDGRTGFLCRDVDDMVVAVMHLSSLDRRDCRAAFEQRFTVERMAEQYVQVYDDLLQEVEVLSRVARHRA
ncbi:MAG: glycosyltransferase family 4 protein [Nitrospirota bacterium]|nr:glycosyltransferase family 4 protein [Nitrospirota bacterium]